MKNINEYRQFTKPAEVHKSVNSLIGILKGINFDHSINEDELEEVINWCNLQRPFADRVPFDEIIPMIDKYLEDGILTGEEIEDILWLCEDTLNPGSEFNTYYDVTTSSIQQLQGMIHGIMADNDISYKEIQQLMEWLKENNFLQGTYPFDEIYSLLTPILENGVIDSDEKNMLRAFFATFIDIRSSYNLNEFELKELQESYSIGGICATDPVIEFTDKTFSFTGTSTHGTRKEIAEMITNKGGIFNNGVTKKTDFLIVGGEGNPCWAFSCYGRKVEKAMELRKQGQKIILVHEEDFLKQI